MPFLCYNRKAEVEQEHLSCPACCDFTKCRKTTCNAINATPLAYLLPLYHMHTCCCRRMWSPAMRQLLVLSLSPARGPFRRGVLGEWVQCGVGVAAFVLCSDSPRRCRIEAVRELQCRRCCMVGFCAWCVGLASWFGGSWLVVEIC